jgi:hypothetical protein
MTPSLMTLFAKAMEASKYAVEQSNMSYWPPFVPTAALNGFEWG